MSKYLPIVCLALFIFGCGKDDSSVIPETHPAYEFYQIAKSGPSTLDICESYGGKGIYPDDYVVFDIFDEGVAKIKQKSSGDFFLGVPFVEKGKDVPERLCCWLRPRTEG